MSSMSLLDPTHCCQVLHNVLCVVSLEIPSAGDELLRPRLLLAAVSLCRHRWVRRRWARIAAVGFDSAMLAIFLYEIPVTAHKPDICTPGTAHHPKFSHMLVLLLGSLGVYILY